MKKSNDLGCMSYIELKNNKNLKVVLCNCGASIYSIKFKNKVMTYVPNDKQEFESANPYFGKTVGPICGRIKDCTLSFDDKTIKLTDGTDNKIMLHSGSYGISFDLFDVTLIEDEEMTGVQFFLHFEDKFNKGFFNSNFSVTYKLHKNEDVLEVINDALTENDSIISMTNHTYFSLGKQSLLENDLFINADYYANLDEDLLLIGKEKVDEVMSFLKPKKIGTYIEQTLPKKARGYDHPYYLNEHSIDEPQIILSSDDVKLSIYTDYDGVVVYTNNYYNNEKMYKKGYNTERKAITIEPQIAPFVTEKMKTKTNNHFTFTSKYKFEENK